MTGGFVLWEAAELHFLRTGPGPDPTLVGSAEDEAVPVIALRESLPCRSHPESSSVRAVTRIVIWTLLALIVLAGAAWALREWSGLPSP